MSEVREPQQARSRAAWQRVLAAGRELLESGGYDALTVSEVCRRAGVTAPSLYARVDGRDALFRAVYEDAMHDVVATEDAAFGATDGSLGSVVRAVVQVFDRHHRLLRAIVTRAASDPRLLEQGARTSRRLQSRVAEALNAGREKAGASREDRARDAARLIYVECLFRTMYGPRFWSDDPESLEAFAERLTTLTGRVLGEPRAHRPR